MKYSTVEQEFINSLIFRKQRLIGAEFELLLMKPNGQAPTFKTVQMLFKELVKRGWAPLKDKETKELVGASNPKKVYGFNTHITVDTGYTILELVIAPHANLHKVYLEYKRILKVILPILHQLGIVVLSYGIQPLVKPSFRLLSPRARYQFFLKRFGTTQANMTVIASTQSNINMTSTKELIDSLNVMLGLVPVQIALLENSPVWNNQLHPKYKSTRSLFWYGSKTNEPWRVGMPSRPFKDLDDYLRSIWGLETFLVYRNNKTYEVKGNPLFHRYLEYGGVGRHITTAKEIKLKPERDDISHHNGFVWWDSRVKTPEKTVYLENRAVSAQPPGEEMAVFAFHLGIIENIAKANKILASYHWDDLRNAKFSALTKALKATIGTEPIAVLTRKMLQIAEEGLKKRGLQEEKYLEPLWERLETLESPADRMIKIYKKGGIKALIDANRITL